MTELSSIGKNIYLDMITYLKPQKSTPSVDPDSLGLKLGAKAVADVDNLPKNPNVAAYYSELLNSGVLENIAGTGLNINDVIKTAMQEGLTAKEAVNVKKAYEVYAAKNPTVADFSVEVDV